MSLRNRLLVSILATLLLSLLAGGAFTYWHAVAKIETEMQAAMAVGSRIARNAVDDWEEATDPARRLALAGSRLRRRPPLAGHAGRTGRQGHPGVEGRPLGRSGAGLVRQSPRRPAQEGGDGSAGDLRQVRHGRAAVRPAQRGRRGVGRRVADAERADDLLRAGSSLRLLDPRQHHSAAAESHHGVCPRR